MAWVLVLLTLLLHTRSPNPTVLFLTRIKWSSCSSLLSSVQFSHSVVSNSLQAHESQHARPPCPSPTPGVYSNPCPSSQWCHPAISSLCCPLLLLPPIPPSIRVFSNESTLHFRWPKYWSFSFSISPSNEHPGLISFRMDWLDLLAVQWTFKSLLQHHSSKASIFRCSAFFTVQLIPSQAVSTPCLPWRYSGEPTAPSHGIRRHLFLRTLRKLISQTLFWERNSQVAMYVRGFLHTCSSPESSRQRKMSHVQWMWEIV